MASILKGQTALGCQLCENEPNIKWKCLECKILMCQRCKEKVHPKFPTIHDHNIIDIRDVGKHEEEKKPDFTKLKCAQHEGQNCCLFCKTCDELVCPLCIANTHKKHDLIELRESYQNRVDKVINRQRIITEGIKIQAIHAEKLKQIRSMYQSRYDRTKQHILDQENVLTIAVNAQTNKLLNELDQKWIEATKSLDSENKQVKENQKMLLEQYDEVNNMIASNDVNKVFNMSDTQLNSMGTNTKQISTTFNSSPTFIPGKISQNIIQFGILDNSTIPYSTRVNVVKCYNTTLKTVGKILPARFDSLLYVQDGISGNVQKVKLGDTLKVILDHNIYAVEIALTSSEDLLISICGSSVIKIMRSGTKTVTDSQYNISPLLPLGLHVTHDNKVIVGARDTGLTWPATGPRQVIVMDQTGRQEKVFQYDKKKPLFNVPVCVSSNSRNRIGVVDRLSSKLKGRVVILDLLRGLKNIYNGHPNINTADNPFSPCDVSSTKSDNFVVPDNFNHTIHVLNSDGDVITYLSTVELGVMLPYSLFISHTGLLYIGCDTCDDSSESAKIYIIKNCQW